jgi:hypothetical protein
MWNFDVSKKQIGLLVLSCMVSLHSLAADNLYSVFSVAYSDVELSQDANKGFGYKMAFGYQIDPQWYVEAGYQQLIHDKLYSTDLPTARDVTKAETLQQGDALFIAFLGKASGPMGELFYRLGVLKTDIRGQQLFAGVRECELGQANAMVITDFGAATMCDYNESGVAGVIGLGFDYFVGARTMVRTEMEYIKGQDNLTVTTFNVGLRYNF